MKSIGKKIMENYAETRNARKSLKQHAFSIRYVTINIYNLVNYLIT